MLISKKPLRPKLQNAGKAAKIHISELKKSKKTMGGGKMPAELSDIDQRIYNLLPQQFDRIEDDFDDDLDRNK
uniref:Uncharacterized protein n=1 Tax=Romanomermis culicivorax TaxID=13658 RepID=A0A915JQ36_ROMCU